MPSGNICFINIFGKLHNTNGPAIIMPSGIEVWYRFGVRHRADGPAVVCCDGLEEWWINGKKHRTDGPAVIVNGEYKEWFIHGKKVDQFVHFVMQQHHSVLK